ncbi:undecaprenyl-diphosphate phosphatase [Nocardioides convexus]|uniref:undecaprenyl-diphosphate phosphatase n=1 Tax=Nocardioides convexus TaxID=2712224 RepID=UPI003100EDBE
MFFRKDIWRIARAWVLSLFKPEYRGTLDARMGWYIIVGSVPIVVLGVLFKDVIERDFRNLWLIGTTLIVMGIVLGVADRVGRTDRAIKQMTLRDAALMGGAQALALVPGVSRSGATLSMGRFLGYDREAATRFAFLLAIPAVVGAGVFELKEIANVGEAHAGEASLRLGADDHRDDRLLRGRLRRDRLAAALRLDEVLHAVRGLPGPARARGVRAAGLRGTQRLSAPLACTSGLRP